MRSRFERAWKEVILSYLAVALITEFIRKTMKILKQNKQSSSSDSSLILP
jgi:hypothetical protein